jgi:hypothetical protein
VADARAPARIRRLLDAAFEKLSHLPSDGWGVALSPLLQNVPSMARYFEVPDVARTLESVLEARPRLMHTAARITSLGNDAWLPWHFHEYDGADGRWDPTRTTPKSRFTRLIATVYVDGSSENVGSITVLPRRLGDTTAPPSLDRDGIWPGQVDVEMRPGSILIHDVALYHAARRGRSDERRRIFGGVYQRASDPVGREVSLRVDRALRRRLDHLPTLRGMLE